MVKCGVVEFDEINRSKATKRRACGDPRMDRRKAEGMYEFVRRVLKLPC
jgi:hypothetical protein